MPFFQRSRAPLQEKTTDGSDDSHLQDPSTLDRRQIKRATRTRSAFGWFTTFCLFATVIFMIMVELGSTHNVPGIRNIWFIRLNLSNVVPLSVPDSVLLNSIAQTLGLHDFYQVGLWNYCEGYTQGVTECTTPHALYWFDPVAIIADQLIAGASIELPSEIGTILNIIHVASNWMFSLFLAGTCLSFVLMFTLHTSVYSRWISFLLTILTFLNGLFITASSVIATVMFVIMRNVFATNTDVNIQAQIGIAMFVCMWFASGLAILAFLFQLGMCCCCASRRDVRLGKKRGSRKAYT